MKDYFFIIAPSCVGKTTVARRNRDVYDIDDAQKLIPREKREYMAFLRLNNEWETHHTLLIPVYKQWLKRVPKWSCILIHSFADARQLGATREDCIVVLPSDAEHERRMASKGFRGESARIARRNRDDVAREVREEGLRCAELWDTAINRYRYMLMEGEANECV
jgi:hypothetical protein